MTIRPAKIDDLEIILSIYSYARRQMALSGNPTQWGNDKPLSQTVLEDILKQQSYVMVYQNCICGVFAFIMGEDPTYRIIENGAWLNDKPYGTIHRIAGNGKFKGIFSGALNFCTGKTDNIRIDTHQDNRIMQHLLEKYGFQKCGDIYIEDGSKRIAYQSDNIKYIGEIRPSPFPLPQQRDSF